MHTLWEIAQVAGREAWRMGWFTVLGITVAALIKTYQLDRKVRQYAGRAGLWGVVLAAAIGSLSPLCSCGILPVVIPMALSGVSLPPLIALLITSPLMDPASFVLTWGGLGETLAWWKLASALTMGLAAGFVTLALERWGYLRADETRLERVYATQGVLAPAHEIACANGFRLRTMNVVARESRWRFFLDRFRDVGLFVGQWVALAILLGAVIQVLVPVRWVTWLLGQRGLWSVVAATLVGLPLPLNQVAAVPVLAGLQLKGLAAGPDLALLIAGPVASLPAMAALAATFRFRVVALYVAIGMAGAVLLGAARMALA